MVEQEIDRARLIAQAALAALDEEPLPVSADAELARECRDAYEVVSQLKDARLPATLTTAEESA